MGSTKTMERDSSMNPNLSMALQLADFGFTDKAAIKEVLRIHGAHDLKSCVRSLLQRERQIMTQSPKCAASSLVRSAWEQPTFVRSAPTGGKKQVKKEMKKCVVCGGGTAIHRHRELCVNLDDRCRKQVETFKQGSTILERRSEWVAALKTMPHNQLAARMLKAVQE